MRARGSVFVALLEIFAASVSAETARRELTLQGTVVCLDAAGAPIADGCDAVEEPRFALRTADGRLVAFLPEDVRVRMFTDPRVRARELRVKGWALPGDETRLEITKVFSVRDGELFDLYYFCPVCNITSHTPGPCWCCRAEFELREEPHRP